MLINKSKIHGLVGVYFKLLFLQRLTQSLFQRGLERERQAGRQAGRKDMLGLVQ